MVMGNFDEFAVVPEQIHDAGEVVVVEGRAVGKTKTGNLLDARATWVWTVRNGLATANHNYHDTDAWRIALTP
jgi:ketosteroid isomerase-like protein